MAKQVRYGIIGCGAIGQRRHIPEAAANPASVVAALCDPIGERVESLATQYEAEAFTDHKQMIKNADIDAVVVGTPNYLHAKQTIDALRAGKHVLCEKPMATTKADAKKMIAEAEKAGRYLMIGQNQRLMPPHVKAKKILSSGVLGKPLTFATTFKHSGPDGWSIDGADSWFFRPEEAVLGAMGDLGIHKADLMRYLLDDEFVEVSGFVENLDKKNADKSPIGLDDNAVMVVKSSKGVVGTLTVSWTNYGRIEDNGTMIYCEKGVMKIGMDPQWGVIVHHSDGELEQHHVGAVATNTKQVGSGIIDSFTDSILRRKKPEIDGNEGYQSLNVILSAMEAAKQGKTIAIKP
jgi:UDP-N-acetylglucosamine 3-dehydrogenase